MNKHKKILLWFVGFIVIFNLGLFVYANTRPVNWLQNEILLHRFFWSMDDVDQFTLHTGFTKNDFIKPFDAHYVDGIFRTRTVSYFFEMVSFKFWQYIEKGFIRNYTLIGLHLLNVGLLWLLISSLIKEKRAALVGSVLLLNAGCAITTLLFPFRNAKLLVMTFFLMAAIMIARTKPPFNQIRLSRFIIFLTTVLLMLLTDETAYFLIFLLLFFVIIRDGIKVLTTPKIATGFLITIFSFFLINYLIFVNNLPSAQLGFAQSEHVKYFYKYFQYFSNYQTLLDVAKSFFGYFLRKDLGYWSLAPVGVAAAIASLLLILSTRKPSRFVLLLSIGIVGTIIVKAFFLPHNGGVHGIIMPPETFFPSLLFFSYYYVYPDVFLISMFIGLLLASAVIDYKRFILVLISVTIINASNVIHYKEGLKEALAFHDWDQDFKQEAITAVSFTQEFMAHNKTWPVYLSFPSGDTTLFKGRIDDGDQYVFARIIPVMFLRSIESGRAICSLGIIKKNAVAPHNELREVKIFVDAGTKMTFDLTQINDNSSLVKPTPEVVSATKILSKNLSVKADSGQRAVFFIKGRATFLFTVNGKKLKGEQIYGQSYQMFSYDFTVNPTDFPAKITLDTIASGGNQEAYLVGPFLVKK